MGKVNPNKFHVGSIRSGEVFLFDDRGHMAKREDLDYILALARCQFNSCDHYSAYQLTSGEYYCPDCDKHIKHKL